MTKIRSYLAYLRKRKINGLLLILLFIGQSCLANNSQITLVTEHLPPYQIVNNNNYEISGFATEIVKEVLKRSQYQYTITAYSWVRSYNLAIKKPNTCIFSIARIPTREQLFSWIGTITEKNNAVVWGLKSNNHSQNIKNIEDLKSYVTAVNKNDVTHIGMKENGFSEGEHLYVLHNSQSLLKLLFKRPEIDFIIADDITINYRAKLAGIDINLLQRVLEIENLSLNFYLACNLNSDKKIIESLTLKLKELHQDGSYQKILARWKSVMPHLL
jgi:polar amino acid transport system substrate-binding protein